MHLKNTSEVTQYSCLKANLILCLEVKTQKTFKIKINLIKVQFFQFFPYHAKCYINYYCIFNHTSTTRI